MPQESKEAKVFGAVQAGSNVVSKVPVPVVDEINAGVQAFLALEPFAQRAILALIHHFKHNTPKPISNLSVKPASEVAPVKGK